MSTSPIPLFNALGVNPQPGNPNMSLSDLFGSAGDPIVPTAQSLAFLPHLDGTYGTSTGGGAGGSAQSAQQAQQAQQQADAYSYLDNQAGQLRGLLGRTDTGLSQGLEGLNNQYTSNVNQQTNQKNQADQNFTDQSIQTTKDREAGYGTADRNANNGYRSLAQIIGRASGTGSTAFQDVLPNAVGKDLTQKRGDINTTYAQNQAGIKRGRDETALSFDNILADLANQRNAGEQGLRSGIEGQRQGINNQLAQNAQQRVQAGNGGAEAALAAAQPYQTAIDSSRNSVEGFFNQFKPTITAQKAAISTPDLAAYKVDRSNVNAQQQGVPDGTNPYSDILRRKLQENSVA